MAARAPWRAIFAGSLGLLGASLLPWDVAFMANFSRSRIVPVNAASAAAALWSARIINSFGLACDVLGVLLIFRYGIVPVVETGGKQLITIKPDADTSATEARHKRWSRVGIALLVAGFLLQLLSNFAPIR